MITTQLIGNLGGGLVWRYPSDGAQMYASVPTLLHLQTFSDRGMYDIRYTDRTLVGRVFTSTDYYITLNPGERITVDNGLIRSYAEIR